MDFLYAFLAIFDRLESRFGDSACNDGGSNIGTSAPIGGCNIGTSAPIGG